jgi:hypothetical protein
MFINQKHALELFARVSCNITGEFDWNPYIPYVIYMLSKIISSSFLV